MIRNTRDKVLELRILGRSIPEIAKTLSVAKSTVVYWLNRSLEMRLINEKLKAESRAKNTERLKTYLVGRSEYWRKRREKIIADARYEYERMHQNPLFLAGISLYWGEGDSNPKNPLRLSNTDPRLVRVYVEFLLQILMVPKEKIRIGLLVYPDQEEGRVKEFWSKATGISTKQFQKTHILSAKTRKNTNEHGICMVIVNTRQEKLKTLEWIDIFSKIYYNDAR